MKVRNRELRWSQVEKRKSLQAQVELYRKRRDEKKVIRIGWMF